VTSPSEYLTAQDIADQYHLKRSSVWEALSRGDMPEPDLVWMRHPLWLPETIKDWRDNMHGAPNPKKRKRRRSVRVKRADRIKQPSVSTGRPPRIAAKSSSNGASAPVVSVVSEQIARQIASALRTDGYHCTTSDVLDLAGSQRERDHERDLLRRRIQAKLRGLKARRL
jgi:hypothetical protein